MVENELLLDNIQIDKREEFKRLYFEYHDTFCQFAYRYVGSMFIAEGIVQDVYLNTLEQQIQLRKIGDLNKYIFQSIKNRAIDHLKHTEVIQKYENEVAFQIYDDQLYDGEFEANDDNIKEQFTKAVEKVIQRFPVRTRKIYEMSRYEGLTYQEIADFLGISNKTVELHMSKALRILRSQVGS